MAPDVRTVWRSPWFDRLGAATYDFFVERERLARVGGALAWGTDSRLLYRSLHPISTAPDGAAILDVPCGGGVAFRALRAEQRVRYVAADLSPGMLRRARREAERRGLARIELMEADVESLPFEDGSFDLCVCLNSLHCFSDAGAGLREIARCLRPGGRLVGDSALRGRGRRYDLVIDLYRRRGIFGPGGTAEDLERWLHRAGLEDVRLRLSGAVGYFEARRKALACAKRARVRS
jgi:ubiquinone/menaquinone biosynthesis C-methylase UbiE